MIWGGTLYVSHGHLEGWWQVRGGDRGRKGETVWGILAGKEAKRQKMLTWSGESIGYYPWSLGGQKLARGSESGGGRAEGIETFLKPLFMHWRQCGR